MSVSRCAGWWDQTGLGRQSMENLELCIDAGQISGSGTDIVADFELTGNLRLDGTVEILKRYQRKHSVLYVGTYDGEGSFHGTWDIRGYRGEWFIRLLSCDQADQEIQDIG